MDDNRTVVDYLKKVTLALEAGSEPDQMNITNGPLAHTFIFGVSAGGINPFEKAFFANAVGDMQTFNMRPENIGDILGHLKCALLKRLPASPPFFLKARITHIAQPENREVIQAIAASIEGCGTGCDCGCGCS